MFSQRSMWMLEENLCSMRSCRDYMQPTLLHEGSRSVWNEKRSYHDLPRQGEGVMYFHLQLEHRI